jgi:hypothetical protein
MEERGFWWHNDSRTFAKSKTQTFVNASNSGTVTGFTALLNYTSGDNMKYRVNAVTQRKYSPKII